MYLFHMFFNIDTREHFTILQGFSIPGQTSKCVVMGFQGKFIGIF